MFAGTVIYICICIFVIYIYSFLSNLLFELNIE